ncbi:kinase-like domain-containing protein [Rhizophagus diaphanus]|nr:kinase-like domain-containing protein [Rhizophagus diaphanus] [Rhizophagus sp. MUCL 43196]
MSYAKKGSLRKCLSDISKFKWQDKLQLLKTIILGLKIIHESNLTHGDFHDGNILMSDNHNELFITDLGLCKPISDSEVNEIYGVLPYMAPEILRNKPYTPASDIYSFSMIMWEFTSEKRPEIIKNTPKCYVDLMKKCWDSNPSNRPTIRMLENVISEWIRCIDKYYEMNSDVKDNYMVDANNQLLKDDMCEFVEANKTLVQEKANTSIMQSHSQAYYITRKCTEILAQVKSDIIVLEKTEIIQRSECFECIVKD